MTFYNKTVTGENQLTGKLWLETFKKFDRPAIAGEPFRPHQLLNRRPIAQTSAETGFPLLQNTLMGALGLCRSLTETRI
jgi:hypothetical protein